MKRLVVLLAALGGAAILVAGSAAAPKSVSILIRHQAHGCHAWSVANGAFKASQTVHVARGGTITIVNDDVMPQKLIQKSGAAVTYVGRSAMNHMAASVKVTFKHAGTYTFVTKAGEDYPGVKAQETVGEDSILKLTVVVS